MNREALDAGDIVALSEKTLSAISDEILRPVYDRSSLTPGIVHIGLGNFHRAHQAWYLHRLMQLDDSKDWAIIGAGVRPNDATQRSKLLEQDCLTTLIQLDPNGKTAEIVGSMIGYVPIETNNAQLIKQLAEPYIRIASLTVTEGGYYIDQSTNKFDSAHEDIIHDAQNPSEPRTAFGAMIEALKIRRANGAKPFTCMSCDNLQGNGDILRQTIVSLAQLSDPDLAQWITSNCAFPNSMVDCIVPATGEKELALVKTYNIDDAVPVTHENFRQWVLEDKFTGGRPDWARVGVTITDNVHDYEAMKLRILNGGHQIIANAGEVISINQIDQCMDNSFIKSFFRKVASTEIAPTVTPVPGMTPEAYVELIDRRFSNAEIIDTVRRVAFDGSSRHPAFLLPTILDVLKSEKSFEGLALAEAIWARMCQGEREDGSTIEANDPHWDSLKQLAQQSKDNPSVWLQPNLYEELANHAKFSERFSYWLNKVWKDGTESAIQAYLDV